MGDVRVWIVSTKVHEFYIERWWNFKKIGPWNSGHLSCAHNAIGRPALVLCPHVASWLSRWLLFSTALATCGSSLAE